MRVLWLCNIAIPIIAKHLNVSIPYWGGWLSGAANAISKSTEVDLSICFPLQDAKELIVGECNGIRYYAYPASKQEYHVYDINTEKWLRMVIASDSPDLVHIWGTESPQALAMTLAYKHPEKTIISIQGLCGPIAKHYFAHMDSREYAIYSIRDIVRRDSMIDQQRKFVQRGVLEKQALQNVQHVIGRTRFDRACIKQLAPSAQYYYCAETLRNSFYENAGAWKYENCEKYSIFVSQANYPLKGFHIVLDALAEIIKKYPNAMIYTTGEDPYRQSIRRRTGYKNFIRQRIQDLGLREHVVFLGSLNEKQMCQRFLKSHVFVSASSIENSPNSVAEAMLLGLPIVASYVGGTMDMLKDGEDGFLYQSDAPYMLVDHLMSVFDDPDMAYSMGQRASWRAKQIFDPQENLQRLLSIYFEVYKD